VGVGKEDRPKRKKKKSVPSCGPGGHFRRGMQRNARLKTGSRSAEAQTLSGIGYGAGVHSEGIRPPAEGRWVQRENVNPTKKRSGRNETKEETEKQVGRGKAREEKIVPEWGRNVVKKHPLSQTDRRKGESVGTQFHRTERKIGGRGSGDAFLIGG